MEDNHDPHDFTGKDESRVQNDNADKIQDCALVVAEEETETPLIRTSKVNCMVSDNSEVGQDKLLSTLIAIDSVDSSGLPVSGESTLTVKRPSSRLGELKDSGTGI